MTTQTKWFSLISLISTGVLALVAVVSGVAVLLEWHGVIGLLKFFVFVHGAALVGLIVAYLLLVDAEGCRATALFGLSGFVLLLGDYAFGLWGMGLFEDSLVVALELKIWKIIALLCLGISLLCFPKRLLMMWKMTGVIGLGLQVVATLCWAIFLWGLSGDVAKFSEFGQALQKASNCLNLLGSVLFAVPFVVLFYGENGVDTSHDSKGWNGSLSGMVCWICAGIQVLFASYLLVEGISMSSSGVKIEESMSGLVICFGLGALLTSAVYVSVGRSVTSAVLNLMETKDDEERRLEITCPDVEVVSFSSVLCRVTGVFAIILGIYLISKGTPGEKLYGCEMPTNWYFVGAGVVAILSSSFWFALATIEEATTSLKKLMQWVRTCTARQRVREGARAGSGSDRRDGIDEMARDADWYDYMRYGRRPEASQTLRHEEECQR